MNSLLRKKHWREYGQNGHVGTPEGTTDHWSFKETVKVFQSIPDVKLLL